MNITSIGLQNSQNYSFGLRVGMRASSILNCAASASYRVPKKPYLPQQTIERIERIKAMFPEHVLTAFLDMNNKGKDVYHFQLTPKGLNPSCAKSVAKIPVENSSLLITAKLEQALKNLQRK